MSRPASRDRPDGDAPDPVLVSGRIEQSFTTGDLREFPRRTLRCTVECASGERTTAEWTGAPVEDLLAAADAPPETTHVRVHARDGYRACIPAVAALDGVLADTRDGTLLSETSQYRTRFLAPGVDGARLAKGVTELECLTVDPGEDIDRLETLALDDPGFE
ncbi:molybdopterin-dependent oxidoreductase [Halobaculum litoreum]|uniref:Molybdopterin-dependent oxidoreductase n=1 Tax=Halobaculum litoreum TaxID=3031998 RepID=A0ABD5XM98_9EURY|nr:molybdopterin-dependent oxidoreductase [Halobaculum sp. DT92]